MTLTDLISEVYTLTNRPDLVGETASAVRAATLRAHHLDYFYKDLIEVPLTFPTSDYYQNIPTPTLPLFRALSYVRKYYPGITDSNSYNNSQLPPLFPWGYDPGANLPDGRFFKVLSPTDVLDSYQVNRVDIAYVAGQQINFKSGDQIQNVLVGYYAHPNITPDGYNSWIAVENPYAIVVDATATVFKTIGYDEQYQAYMTMLKQEQDQLVFSNVIATGS